jgi:RNase P/RNase MRP subunit p30
MFDIIKCKADASRYGFDRFYLFDDVNGKILQAENLQAAARNKNKKALVMLRDHAFDEGAIKVIAEKKKLCFLIDLGRLIDTKGVPRAIAMSKLRNFLRLCVKHGAFYAFASFAEKENRIRTADELVHIAMLFNLNRGQAEFALKMLQHYV